MQEPTLPISLRRAVDEEFYQKAKAAGDTRPLAEEPSVKEWQYWRLIGNRYPYTIAFREHHMLVTKRVIGGLQELKIEELLELIEILCTFAAEEYDLWFVNTNKKRSILSHFHVHLATYWPGRKDMSL